MSKMQFVYVTYIATTPEKLWNALTDPATTRQYWGRRMNVSNWKEGSEWRHQDQDDPALVDIVGSVVESAPPRRLVLTWARPADAANETGHSRVTFTIKPVAEAVQLTVIHDELETDSDMLRDISRGWPAVLSSMKTFLETGTPMTITTERQLKWPID